MCMELLRERRREIGAGIRFVISVLPGDASMLPLMEAPRGRRVPPESEIPIAQARFFLAGGTAISYSRALPDLPHSASAPHLRRT